MPEKATKGLHDKVEKERAARYEDQTGQQHDVKYPGRTILNQDPRFSNCQKGQRENGRESDATNKGTNARINF
jgi:hypothetical protein